jgi:diacylglycerol kinase (ATP)
LTPLEWAVLLLVIGLVISLEILNTAVEAVVDLCSPEQSELARIAKDAAAGAVLVAAITAVAVGAFIFVPALWNL